VTTLITAAKETSSPINITIFPVEYVIIIIERELAGIPTGWLFFLMMYIVILSCFHLV